MEAAGTPPELSAALPGLQVDELRCTGCGRCVAACPLRRFTLEPKGYRKIALFRDGGCGNCRLCVDACPVKALTV